jgi:hypothetical protein
VSGALSLAPSPTNGSSGSCSYMTYSGDNAATYGVAVSAPGYQPATVDDVTAPPPTGCLPATARVSVVLTPTMP